MNIVQPCFLVWILFLPKSPSFNQATHVPHASWAMPSVASTVHIFPNLNHLQYFTRICRRCTSALVESANLPDLQWSSALPKKDCATAATELELALRDSRPRIRLRHWIPARARRNEALDVLGNLHRREMLIVHASTPQVAHSTHPSFISSLETPAESCRSEALLSTSLNWQRFMESNRDIRLCYCC